MGEGVHNPADIDTLALEATLQDLHNDLILVAAACVIIDNEVGQVHTAVDAIQAMTDSMPILTETGGTLTSDGTVQTVYINNAPDGVYKPICIKVDFTDHTVTETVVLRESYRIVDGGDLILQDVLPFVGLVSPELIKIGLDPNRFGIEVTLEKTAGTNRDYDWEIFYEV